MGSSVDKTPQGKHLCAQRMSTETSKIEMQREKEREREKK